MINQVFNFLLDLLFPKFCVSCGKWGKFICDNCFSKIEFFSDQVCPYCERPSPYGFIHPRCSKPQGLDGMFVLAHYRGPIKKALHEIKYRGTYGIINELVGQLVSKYHNKFDFDCLVPVPLHSNRERERGFNQAEKIEQELADKLNQMKVVNLLQRIRPTTPQFDLKIAQRKENVKDAFGIGYKFKGKSLNFNFCLVDDVATTGATIFECARVLKKSGAKKVYAICVARGG